MKLGLRVYLPDSTFQTFSLQTFKSHLSHSVVIYFVHFMTGIHKELKNSAKNIIIQSICLLYANNSKGVEWLSWENNNTSVCSFYIKKKIVIYSIFVFLGGGDKHLTFHSGEFLKQPAAGADFSGYFISNAFWDLSFE